MITKAELDQLRAGRSQPNVNLEYTIGGTIQSHVHSDLAAERERKISKGEQTLREAHEELRQDFATSSHEGLSKAHFNKVSQEIKP